MSRLMTWFGRGLDQDWVDAANGFWSVLLLAVCSFGAFLARYATQPISCFIPTPMSAQQALHIQQTCFRTEDKLFLGITRNTQNDNPISYHLWIPLILALQAVCFKIPNVIWNVCKMFNLDETVSSLENAEQQVGETRTATLKNSALVLYSVVRKRYVHLTLIYLAVKALYLLNLLGQFIFLTIFFRQMLPLKPEVVDRIRFHVEAPNTISFLPTEVMCRYSLVQHQNVQQFLFQCQLLVSEIYQKLFVFLWYWVFFLAVVTFFNLLLWAGFLFIPFLRDSRIAAYINTAPQTPTDFHAVKSFVGGFLGVDGVLVLSMISLKSSEIVAASLCQMLYKISWELNNPVSRGNPVESRDSAMSVTSVPSFGSRGNEENIIMAEIPDPGMEKPLIAESGQ